MSDVHMPLLASYKLPLWFEHLANLPFVGPIICLVGIVMAALVPAKYAELPKQHIPAPPESQLFPSMSAVTEIESKDPQTPQPCSTGLTTRLLPFKNAKGEIEWAFTEDLPPGSELDAFKSPEAMVLKFEKSDDILSPVTSNSSNNDSLISSKKLVSSVLPQMNTPTSTMSEDEKNKDDDLETEGGDNLYHQCPHCDSTFKMRGYLTRHLKKHAPEKAYRCPFHKSSIYVDNNDVTHQCHPSGGFSRRDTYKTHLKARHFRYPEGVTIKERGLSTGNCSMCGEWFENAEIWCEIHIEGGECKHLPAGFKGKSRIKNRLKKQMNRMMKQQRQKLKVSAEQLLPTLNTPGSQCTPSVVDSYDCNSPASVSSSIDQHRPQPLVSSVPSSVPESVLKSPDMLHDALEFIAYPESDYDDDFCLDTDQLGMFPSTPFHPAQMRSGYVQSVPSVYSVPQYTR